MDLQLFRKIFVIALPLIIAHSSTPLVSLVDTALLGHVGDARFLAAGAVGSSLITFIFWSFGFLRMGTTALTAEAHGQQDKTAEQHHLLQSSQLALIISATILILHPWLLRLGLHIIEPSPDTYAITYEYTNIRILSVPACLVNYVIIGWLIAKQNSRQAMLCTLLLNSVNIVADIILIQLLKTPSNGAAYASLLAEYCCLAYGLYVLRHHYTISLIPSLLNYRAPSQSLSKLLNTHSQLFVRLLAILSAMSFFTAQSARYGHEILAANTILLQLVLLCSYAMDGFANAAESLCGEAKGRGHFEQFKAIFAHTAMISLMTGFVFSLTFWQLKLPLLNMFTDLPTIIALSQSYYGWIILLPLLGVWCYFLDGVFVGLGDTRTMRNSMLLALLGFCGSYYLLKDFGNHALWLSFILFHLLRSLAMLPHLRKIFITKSIG